MNNNMKVVDKLEQNEFTIWKIQDGSVSIYITMVGKSHMFHGDTNIVTV